MKKQILLSAVGVSLISLGMANSADADLTQKIGVKIGVRTQFPLILETTVL